MFGNLLGGQLLKQYFGDAADKIRIRGDGVRGRKKLGFAEYTLYASQLFAESVLDGKSYWALHDLKNAYEMEPHEYVRIQASEQVILPPGVVGRFTPASSLIEIGLLLTAGKLDPEYGAGGEHLTFGLFNARSSPVTVTHDLPLAHLSFFDIRGFHSAGDAVPLSEYEQIVWALRKAETLLHASDQLEAHLSKEDVAKR